MGEGMGEAESGGPLWSVEVRPWLAERAAVELRLWREENAPAPAPGLLPPAPEPGDLWPTAAALLVLVLFFVWQRAPHPGLGLYPHLWLELGSAEAGAILRGECWRLVTALTLHADGPHVVGNAAVGGVFLVLACRSLGCGPAWALVMASGMLGNLLNALALGPPHNSIGFSTAVFGAAGVLAGQSAALGGGAGLLRRAALPVAAGLGILAMLGAGDGEGNTDLGAHLFGFAAGVPLGALGGWFAALRGRPGPALNAALLLAAWALPVLAWARALAG
jgi:membrane associated rhomboid family serine protease